jgi:hypothetical protein
VSLIRCANWASSFGSKTCACSTRNASMLWSCSAWTAAGSASMVWVTIDA